MSKLGFSRRAFLRGSAGAIIALPVFDFMLNSHGTAYADGTPLPKTFVVYYWGQGMSRVNWNPAGNGPTWTIDDTAAVLGDRSPLTPFKTRGLKDYCNIGKNFSVYATRADGADGHYPYSALILTGKQRNSANNTYRGPTIDYLVRSGLMPGAQGRILDFQLATSASPLIQHNSLSTTRSYNGAGTLNIPDFQPVQAFDRIFGGVTVTPESPESFKNRRRKAVLDAVRDDAGSFRSKLGQEDKVRFDAHLSTVKELGDRVAGLVVPGSNCTIPARPTGPYAAHSQYYGQLNEPMVELNDLLTDVFVAGMNCGAVPFLNYSFNSPYGGGFHHDVPSCVALGPQTNGLAFGGYHNELSHGNSAAWVTPPSGDQMRRAYNDCNRTILDKVAVLAEKMKNVTVGADSNLLKQSLIFCTSEHSDAHNPHDMPILLVGSAGGALKFPGVMAVGAPETRGATYEQSSGGRNANDVLVTIMKAMGIASPTAGDPGSEIYSTGADVVSQFLV